MAGVALSRNLLLQSSLHASQNLRQPIYFQISSVPVSKTYKFTLYQQEELMKKSYTSCHLFELYNHKDWTAFKKTCPITNCIASPHKFHMLFWQLLFHEYFPCMFLRQLLLPACRQNGLLLSWLQIWFIRYTTTTALVLQMHSTDQVSSI